MSLGVVVLRILLRSVHAPCGLRPSGILGGSAGDVTLKIRRK